MLYVYKLKLSTTQIFTGKESSSSVDDLSCKRPPEITSRLTFLKIGYNCMKLLPVVTADLIGWFLARQCYSFGGAGHLSNRCLQPKWTNKFDCFSLRPANRHLAAVVSEDSNTLKDTLEKSPVSHLLHGSMTFERRESSGSGSSLSGGGPAEEFKRPFIIGVAGGTASGKVKYIPYF